VCGLLLPEDIHVFEDETDESLGKQLRGLWYPWRRYGAVVLLGNLNPGLHTPVNVNGSDVNGTPVNANGPGVDGD